ncbi:MAG: efflux RND transporter permease subunit [Planctomycetota bacterium]
MAAEPTLQPLDLPPSEGGPLDGGLFEGTVRRPVALMVIFATLIVIGVIAYRQIPVQMVPDGWTAPQLWLGIPHPGADAEENEEKVARVVEEQLRTLAGVEGYESWSEDGWIEMNIDFDSSMDMDLAKAEVRDRIERARPMMPDTVDRVYIWSEDGSQMPIAFFGILHPGDSARTDYLMDKIVIPRIEAVQGVSKVDVWGVLQDSVRILLDEEKVVAQNLNLGELIGRMMQDNFAQPLGEVDDGGREIILRSDMRFRTLEEIADYPLGNGLRIRDVGEVRRVKSVRNMLSRIDGSYSYFGVARKDSESNVVDTSHNLQAAIAELEADPRLAGEFKFINFFMQGDLIESSLAQLRETAIWGGVLSLVVLFVFLRRVRLTLCVACSIPVSALMAVAWERFTGGSFNLLTMCGITLGIGMLVDNSVVVIENIARVRQDGTSPLRAAAVGTRQIALAVTLATMTTVVVFLPLIFMTGEPILRVIFGGIGIPLCVSLVFSLLVAVVFLPVISARILGPRPAWLVRGSSAVAPLTRLPVRLIAYVVGGLRAAWHGLLGLVSWANRGAVSVAAPLRFVLAAGVVALAVFGWMRLAPSFETGESLRPFGVLPSAAEKSAPEILGPKLLIPAVLFVGLALVGLPRWRRRAPQPPERPARFVPAGDSLLDMVVALNRRLVGWTLEHRFAAVLVAIGAFATIWVPLDRNTVTAFGEDPSTESARFRVQFDTDFTLREAEDELAVYERYLDDNKERLGFDHWSNRFDDRGASISVYFDQRQLPDKIDEIERDLKANLPRVPGHRLRFYDDSESTARSKTITAFRITGPDSGMLERLGLEAKRLLEDVPGLKGVSTPRETAPDQVRVEIDRDLAQEMGLDTDSVQQTISYVLRGFALPRYQEEGRDVPLQIEYDEEKVAGLASLKDLGVWSGSGVVPLSSFSELSFAKGSHSIHRRNGRTSFTLTGEVEDPLRLLEVTDAGNRALAQLDLPRGYEVDLADSARERQEAEFGELLNAFLLSVVLVFLLMGILFESMLLPFSVLFTIPFAVLGAMWTLLLTGTPMDSMGWIGIIILAGVVVNNGIVLIDRIHRLAAQGLERRDAVLLGCGQRVRPVLMTALTTVCGLIPMAMAQPTSDGIDYRALATIVAGGLVTSTFFTLWVVPLAYTVLDDLGRAMAGYVRWWGTLSRRVRRVDLDLDGDSDGDLPAAADHA